MIFDHIQNLSCYRSLMPAIRAVEHYLASVDPMTLEAGKHPVGRGITVSVNLYTPSAREDGAYETHRRYIDLQYLIAGHEDMYVSALSDLQFQEAYQPEKDIAFCSSPAKETVFSMNPGDFALLFPQDAHMPGIRNDRTAGEIRKLVFKIPMPHAENQAFLAELLPIIKMPEDASALILETAQKIPDETVRSITEHFFADADVSGDIKTLAETLSVSLPLCNLVVYLLFAKVTFDRYLENGIDLSVYYESLTDFTVWEHSHRVLTGETGLSQMPWLAMTLKQKLYRLGRFQYEMHTYHRQTYDGGTWRIQTGDPFLYIHIPEGCPLTDEVRMDSYRKAAAFFAGRGWKLPLVFCCASWLLYPAHRDFLQKGSNIVRFMDDFTMLSSDEERGDYSNLWRIYGKYDPAHLENLPEKTGMQRAYKEHLLKTGCTGNGYGIFCWDGTAFRK